MTNEKIYVKRFGSSAGRGYVIVPGTYIPDTGVYSDTDVEWPPDIM